MQQLLGKAKDYQVEILRDNLGIPHVYGKKDVDTAFGLGYAQSEDDFVTLQSVLLATRGQLAAERGYSSAKTDFIVEFMGVWQTVNEQYEKQVPPQIKAIAQAYADGVNTFAAQNPNSVSRYLLPVTAKDIIAGFTFKTPMFYGFDQALGELLNPEYPHEFAKNDSSLSWQPSQQLPIGSQGIAIAPHRSA
ncbi:MAG: penicillin acylase family protein, partial [Kangiellaceae bacterium]|nr:penicillin acylase family protein [Kangiellaceae bacterium]